MPYDELRAQISTLMQKQMQKLRVYLRPLNDDEAVSLGLGRFTGETITAREIDGVQHLEIEGCLFRKV